jgi:hypothetical protein
METIGWGSGKDGGITWRRKGGESREMSEWLGKLEWVRKSRGGDGVLFGFGSRRCGQKSVISLFICQEFEMRIARSVVEIR